MVVSVKLRLKRVSQKCLSVKTVLTLRVKLPCRKCKIFVLSFIVSEKNKRKRWTMRWRFGLKIREQFTVSAFSLTV